MINFVKLLMVIVAAAFITVIHHANGNDAESTERNAPDYPPWLTNQSTMEPTMEERNQSETRHPVGSPCDTWANCEKHLCCARMTERNGNKCYERNSTIGARCSTNRWPRGSKILSFIGGCPCAKGLRCKMNQKLGYGTCEYRINTQRKV